MFMETSAKEDDNIQEAFFKLIEDIHKKTLSAHAGNTNNTKKEIIFNKSIDQSSKKYDSNCCKI